MSLQSKTSLKNVITMIKKCGVRTDLCDCIENEYQKLGRLPEGTAKELANAVIPGKDLGIVHKDFNYDEFFWFWLYKKHECFDLIRLLANRAGGFVTLTPPESINEFGNFAVKMADIFEIMDDDEKESFEALLTRATNRDNTINEREMKANTFTLIHHLMRTKIYNDFIKKIIDQLDCDDNMHILSAAMYYNYNKNKNIELVEYILNKCKNNKDIIESARVFADRRDYEKLFEILKKYESSEDSP